ncbi:MAG: hypothetical protein J0H14_01515 [Alphaproteobacteria bacterium]|nr:hypothetical protein [Alphaproteobacteria bacterium]
MTGYQPLALVGAALALLSVAGCTVNTSPPPAAVAPAPVVVQQPAPPPAGAVVVQPRAY